jgi:small neutral amino acid transporter SnatA (MarC family)
MRIFALGLLLLFPLSAQAADGMNAEPTLGARKIFLLLFLMLGPIKILVPFVEMTRGTDASFQRHLATRALLFSAAALILAGALGRNILENFSIPVPVLALTGGLVLFLVALQTILQQFSGPERLPPPPRVPELRMAITPLAFPTIVTPYGIAAIIIFIALAQDDGALRLTVAGVTFSILLMDWLAMLFAHVILRWFGPVLQVFAVVLGVTQVALGLQVILRSLSLLGVFAERGG